MPSEARQSSSSPPSSCPILLVVVGIIQFGLIFGANVTLTNAAREAARAATIVRYDIAASRAVNDLDRCTAALDAARRSFGLLIAPRRTSWRLGPAPPDRPPTSTATASTTAG